MRCQDVMNKDVQCLETGDSCVKAAQLMRDEDIGFLPVCDADEKVLGVLTDRDIAIRAVAENRCDARAEECMSRDIVFCRADDDLSRAEELMCEKEVSRILVLDDAGKAIGIISLGDLSQHDEEDAGEVLAEVKSGVEAHP